LEQLPPVYDRIRHRARQIAARFPTPEFYITHAPANRQSLEFFEKDSVISRLKKFVSGHMENNFGHGIDHAVQVAVDAGALMIIESKDLGYSDERAAQQLRMIQSAGLLHDIKRKHRNHALEGALFARKILKRFSFSQDEAGDICYAIRNHEAFTDHAPSGTPERELISGCLYDADKFRWGPDNFKYTIWDMISFSNIPFREFVARYPKGMEGLERIKQTFRTPTGRSFGPQFIEFGIDIGRELFEVIQTEFSEYL